MRDLLLPPAPLFDRTDDDGRSFVPTKVRKAGARSGGPGRPPGRRDSALPWTGASPPARWPLIGTATLVLALGSPARCEVLSDPTVAAVVAEAAQRFAVPEHWIRAVMRVESGFRADAVSPKGAMGLMQVMPATYADLRQRYGLGADPFAVRDNVLAGAAYLREMYDRYGARGVLAAYNAGPARYEAHLAGRALPLETQAYVAQLAPALRIEPGLRDAAQTRPRPGLFAPVGVTSQAESSPSSALFAPLTPQDATR